MILEPFVILSTTFLLFMVIDPIGNMPLFVCILKDMEQSKRRRVVIRELGIALLFLVIFLFVGRYILSLLGISEQSLGIAGGVILFLIAIRMIFSGSENIFSGTDQCEPFIVPLAVPLIAGPSAMTTLVLLMASDPSRWQEWFLSLILAWILSGIILLFSSTLNRLLGTRGLIALERLMGMILTTVAVEMFIQGLMKLHFQ